MRRHPPFSMVRVLPENIVGGCVIADLRRTDGCVLRFRRDREVSEEGAMIIGITAEDATLRREYGYAP